jgi:hypothetical protein
MIFDVETAGIWFSFAVHKLERPGRLFTSVLVNQHYEVGFS